MKIYAQIVLIILMTSQTIYSQHEYAKTLKVGDNAPEIRALKWVKGETIEAFRKNHFYVVEFGATWCAPCRAAIPKLTKLADEHKSKLSVIGFFVMEVNSNLPNEMPSFLEKVIAFVDRQGDKMDYAVAIDDANGFMAKTWIQAAGLNGIPQSFIIGPDGKIAWIGSDTETLALKVRELLNTGQIVSYKKNIVPDDTQTIIPEHCFNTLFLSSLSKYETGQPGHENPGFITSYRWATEGSEYAKNQGTVRVTGETLRRLYYMAYGDTLYNYPMMMSLGSRVYADTIKNPYQKRSYGKYWYRPILELTDSSQFEARYTDSQNRFNYSLTVPKKVASAFFLQQAMRRDLKTYFGYNVHVEERLMPCWNLVASDEARNELISKKAGMNQYEVDSLGNYHFRNAEIRDLIFELEIRYGYGQVLALTHNSAFEPPFFDATGIKGAIDYPIKTEDAKAIINAANDGKEFSFNNYLVILKSFGLDLVKSYRKMKVVVIKDRDEAN